MNFMIVDATSFLERHLFQLQNVSRVKSYSSRDPYLSYLFSGQGTRVRGNCLVDVFGDCEMYFVKRL